MLEPVRSTIDGRPSTSVVHVCLRQRMPRISEYAEQNRTEFNLRSGKSEAEVRLITEDCARRIVLLELTTDRHKASCGLSATAGLLVFLNLRENEGKKVEKAK